MSSMHHLGKRCLYSIYLNFGKLNQRNCIDIVSRYCASSAEPCSVKTDPCTAKADTCATKKEDSCGAKKEDSCGKQADACDKKDDGPPSPPPPLPPKPRMKAIEIYRWQPGEKPRMQTYTVDLNKSGPMVLDALIYIKNEMDPTLTFRRSCREGICGSCSCNVDGYNTLSCIDKIDKDLNKPCKIYPLPHMYVIRDLISDMNNFFNQYRTIQPWLQRKDPCAEPLGTAQYLQGVGDRAKLDGLFDCVLCGCCTIMNGPDGFDKHRYLGPSILMHAYKWIIDSRDEMHEERLDRLRDVTQLKQAQTTYSGVNWCPKKLNPGKAIIELKQLLNGTKQKDKPEHDPAALFKSCK